MDSDRKRGEILKDFQILTFSYLITIQRYREEGTYSKFKIVHSKIEYTCIFKCIAIN